MKTSSPTPPSLSLSNHLKRPQISLKVFDRSGTSKRNSTFYETFSNYVEFQCFVRFLTILFRRNIEMICNWKQFKTSKIQRPTFCIFCTFIDTHSKSVMRVPVLEKQSYNFLSTSMNLYLLSQRILEDVVRECFSKVELSFN